MGKNLKYFLLGVTLLFTVQSCKKDDEALPQNQESKLIQASISGVNGPTAGIVGKELSFDLTLVEKDANTRFNRMSDSAVGNTRFIKLYSLTNVPDTSMLKPIGPVSYKFKADTSGVFYLKFFGMANGKPSVITDTLVIR